MASVVGTPIGYVVLTKQADGSWRDDWDGEVHVDRNTANDALTHAQNALDGGVMLAALYPAACCDHTNDPSVCACDKHQASRLHPNGKFG